MTKVSKAVARKMVLWFQLSAVGEMPSYGIVIGRETAPGPGWYQVPDDQVQEIRDAVTTLGMMYEAAVAREDEARQSGR